MSDEAPDNTFSRYDPGVARTIAERISALRRARGLSASDLARKSGVDRSNISRIESGRHQPTAATIDKLASALGVLPGEIFLYGAERVTTASALAAAAESDLPRVSIRELSVEVHSSARTVAGALSLLAKEPAISEDQRLAHLLRIAQRDFQRIVQALAHFAVLEEQADLDGKLGGEHRVA